VSAAGDRASDREACPLCLRRSWLLGQLSGPLDYCARDRERLLALLGLADEQLIAAVGGRRKQELSVQHEAFAADRLRRGRDVQTTCSHRREFPRLLRTAGAPHMFYVSGPVQRLWALSRSPAVALVGSRRASDYGMQMARSLARGLAVSGVTVASAMTDGIALAAQLGAIECGGRSVVVVGGGLGTCPASRRALLQRIAREGCAVSELPCESGGRRWGQLAAERTVVGLAALTIVVEARDTAEDLAAARIARALGRAVAAIPGRVTSPLSRGTNDLLMDGAKLLRGAQDALELLFGLEAMPTGASAGASTGVRPRAQPRTPIHDERFGSLEPRLQRVLERVGEGEDTPQVLSRAKRTDADEVLLALSELELMGLLSRGAGGRYVPCEPSAPAAERAY
jgi:DNA processing protein